MILFNNIIITNIILFLIHSILIIIQILIINRSIRKMGKLLKNRALIKIEKLLKNRALIKFKNYNEYVCPFEWGY